MSGVGNNASGSTIFTDNTVAGGPNDVNVANLVVQQDMRVDGNFEVGTFSIDDLTVNNNLVVDDDLTVGGNIGGDYLETTNDVNIHGSLFLDNNIVGNGISYDRPLKRLRVENSTDITDVLSNSVTVTNGSVINTHDHNKINIANTGSTRVGHVHLTTTDMEVGTTTAHDLKLITNNVARGTINATTGNTVFTGTFEAGAIATSGSLSTSSTTASTSSTTGAFICGGGAGIAGAINTAGVIKTTNTTASTSTTSGALQVGGGIGAVGAIYCAGVIKTTDSTVSSSTTTGSLVVGGGAGIPGAINSAGIIKTTNATASTSTSTGAIVCTGGIGCGGTVSAAALNVPVVRDLLLNYSLAGSSSYGVSNFAINFKKLTIVFRRLQMSGTAVPIIQPTYSSTSTTGRGTTLNSTTGVSFANPNGYIQLNNTSTGASTIVYSGVVTIVPMSVGASANFVGTFTGFVLDSGNYNSISGCQEFITGGSTSVIDGITFTSTNVGNTFSAGTVAIYADV